MENVKLITTETFISTQDIALKEHSLLDLQEFLIWNYNLKGYLVSERSDNLVIMAHPAINKIVKLKFDCE